MTSRLTQCSTEREHGRNRQYEPERLPEMIRPVLEGEADACFGSRMMEKGAARKGGGHQSSLKKIQRSEQTATPETEVSKGQCLQGFSAGS